MGTSRSPAELAMKLRKAGGAIDGAAKDGVFKASMLVKTSVLAELHGVTRLRGVGKRGAKISVGFRVGGVTNPSSLVRMRGPAHLIEGDTKAHKIEPKGKKRAILTPAGPRASANHPGTRGKHPWEKGVKRALPNIPKVMMDEQVASLRRFFG